MATLGSARAGRRHPARVFYYTSRHLPMWNMAFPPGNSTGLSGDYAVNGRPMALRSAQDAVEFHARWNGLLRRTGAFKG